MATIHHSHHSKYHDAKDWMGVPLISRSVYRYRCERIGFTDDEQCVIDIEDATGADIGGQNLIVLTYWDIF